ncbi:MAG: prepilin-type cleavage/methylation domain-containing protein [Desertifilum sp. SIO1I2]|nr:prepilin-type cleavage/methylation domain-containing protein [Desertifilum sp. SIO1I2]
MVDILQSDRQEQVKAITEQEIQTALDYIARDLETAVYIYDADGLYGVAPQGDPTNPIINQLPPLPAEKQGVPVLVFWKRSVLARDSEVTLRNSNRARVGCLVGIPPTSTPDLLNCLGQNPPGNEQDHALYSLVAYYLVRDTTCSSTNTFSCTTRIERFEVRDGIRFNDSASGNRTPRDGTRTEPNNLQPVKYDLQPSFGFIRFNLSGPGDTLQQKMNQWRRHPNENYDLNRDKFITLVDYIDQSRLATSPNLKLPEENDCKSTVSQSAQITPQVMTRNGAPTIHPTIPEQLQTGSFYACVDSNPQGILARVYIRGNALARTVGKHDERAILNRATFTNNRAAYFPESSVQIRARGLLNAK